VTADYRTVNVQSESADPGSLLNWYRRLIALRRSNPALRDGRTVMLDVTNASVLSYARVAPDGAVVVVSLNMSPTPQTFSLGLAAAGIHGSHFKTELASPAAPPQTSATGSITLQPYAAWVAAVR
jgi:alpha-glucosidase